MRVYSTLAAGGLSQFGCLFSGTLLSIWRFTVKKLALAVFVFSVFRGRSYSLSSLEPAFSNFFLNKRLLNRIGQNLLNLFSCSISLALS